MQQFIKRVRAERFFMSGDPETYPEGLKWDHEDSHYVIMSRPGGVKLRVLDGSWVVHDEAETKVYSPDRFDALFTAPRDNDTCGHGAIDLSTVEREAGYRDAEV